MNTKTRKTNNGNTKGKPKSFTPQEVGRSLLKALAPALEARGGRVDLGGCPPKSPTDPGLHITRTRFLIS